MRTRRHGRSIPTTCSTAIAAIVPRTARVWEPGCGSGQATRGLAARFAHVHATEPSVKQLAQHWAQPGTDTVSLAVEPGERTTLPDGSMRAGGGRAGAALVRPAGGSSPNARACSLQAACWLAWGYEDFIAPDGMVEAVEAFRAAIEPYWPPERGRWIDDAATLTFRRCPRRPWLESPGACRSSCADRRACRRPRAARLLLELLARPSVTSRRDGTDPVAASAPREAIAAAWGDPDPATHLRGLRWPVLVQARRTLQLVTSSGRGVIPHRR